MLSIMTTKMILKMKFTKFLQSILIILLFTTHLSCKNISIRSQYKYNEIKNKRICVHMNIGSRFDKIFLRKLLEEPSITKTNDCDYHLIAVLIDNETPLKNVAGIAFGNMINMEAKYSLYKNDKTKTKQIQQILNTPVIYSSEQYTGQLNASMSKKTGSVAGNQNEKKMETNNINRVYIGTKVRLDKILKNISNNTYQDQKPYLVSKHLLPNINQVREDAEIQLAKLLAERVSNDAILEIIKFEKSK